MRLSSVLTMLAAAILLLATGGPSSFAEGDTFLMRDPTLQKPRGLFNFSVTPRQQRPAPRQQRAVQPRRTAPAVVVRDDPVIPKIDVRHHIIVVGDTLADQISAGLDDLLADRDDVAVLRRAKPDSGLVRSDFYDWPRAVAEMLAADPKIFAGVILVGPNDRQPIREGDVTHEPLSEAWLTLYRARVESVIAAFAARRVPLIWVGTPPMQNGRLSADLTVLNGVFQKSVAQAGGHFVELWTPYLDAENRYSAMGPDVDGQITRLRLGDGVHFTKAGARKAAHFVDLIVRRLLDGAPGEPLLAMPAAPPSAAVSLAPGTVEQLIDAMMRGHAGDLTGLPSLPAKPLAGPILPLTGAPAAAEPALVATIEQARGGGDAAARLDQVFGEGVAPAPLPGRADDFRWPRPE